MSRPIGFLFVPVVLSFLCSLGCMFWYVQFLNRIPVAEAKLSRLEKDLIAVECAQFDKDVVLGIARQSLEQDKRFGNLLLSVGALFFFLGVVGLSVALGQPLRRQDDPAPAAGNPAKPVKRGRDPR